MVDSQTTKRVIGVVTDRDIALHLVRTNTLANHVPVEACMTNDPTVIAPDADLKEAAQVMEQIAVHRLPVVEDGRLIGVLSLKDIALAARKEWALAGAHVAEQQMVDVLEAITTAQTARKGSVERRDEPAAPSAVM